MINQNVFHKKKGEVVDIVVVFYNVKSIPDYKNTKASNVQNLRKYQVKADLIIKRSLR